MVKERCEKRGKQYEQSLINSVCFCISGHRYLTFEHCRCVAMQLIQLCP